MQVLFVHQVFPAQFGHVALELTRRYGWTCTYLCEGLTTCPVPSPAMLERVEVRRLELPPSYREQSIIPWTQSLGRYLELGRAVLDAVRGIAGRRPDLVVGHSGLGPTLFLREVLDCPIITYCEYAFAVRGRDLTYRLDLPPVSVAPFYPRCINASTTLALLHSESAYAPTQWQRQTFAPRFWPKIEVHFDGIDTELYRPRTVPRTLAGRSIPEGTRVVTYVARGLESMRGFDLFMKVARRIARERSDVLFVVVGGDQSHYSWDRLHTGHPNFREWVLGQDQHDLSRFVFLGQLEPERLAEVFNLSDLHVYLTVPFCLSWSLFDALSCGCTVLASDVPPVREVIEPGVHGLLEPFFDLDRLTETALRVLADPGAYRPLGQAGRARVLERYSLEVAIPDFKDYFERVAAAGPGVRSRGGGPGPVPASASGPERALEPELRPDYTGTILPEPAPDRAGGARGDEKGLI